MDELVMITPPPRAIRAGVAAFVVCQTPRQVDVDHVVPLGVAQFVAVAIRTDARIGEDDIETAKRLHALGNRCGQARAIAHIPPGGKKSWPKLFG